MVKDQHELEDGDYKGTPQDWQYDEVGPQRKPIVRVRFEVELPGGKKRFLDWTGWLTTDKAKAFTHKSLRTCGFRDTDLVRFGKGREGLALDPEKTVSLTIENETSSTDGRTYPKIRFVNPAGFGSGATAAPDKLAGFTFEPEEKQAREERGTTDNYCAADDDADDLPF